MERIDFRWYVSLYNWKDDAAKGRLGKERREYHKLNIDQVRIGSKGTETDTCKTMLINQQSGSNSHQKKQLRWVKDLNGKSRVVLSIYHGP